MYTKYDYWIFRGSIDEKVCSDIIEIGTSQIEQEKNKGIDVTGLTGGNSEKKDDDVRLALGDRTLQQAKKEFGLTEENIYKKTCGIGRTHSKFIHIGLSQHYCPISP